MKRFLTVDEVSRELGVTRARGYQMVAENHIPSVRMGRRVLIPARALDEMCEDAIRRWKRGDGEEGLHLTEGMVRVPASEGG